jgi:hypothetical protein
MLRPPRLLAIGLVALTGVGILALVAQNGSAQPSRDLNAPAEPWPPFVMEYRVTVHGAGPSGPFTGDQMTRLDYTDRRHFVITILDHPAGQNLVGRSWTIDGDRVIIFRPPNGTTIGTSPGPDGGAVPDDWIVPGAAPPLTSRPGVQVIAHGDGTATAMYTSADNGRTSRKEIRFRQVDGIPLGMVEWDNGQLIRRAEVTKLEFKAR